MSVVVLTSAAGSPGVTSTAIGLTLGWPRSALLVDADPGAGHAVLAGFLRGRAPGGRGLVRVAEGHRERRSLREVVLDQSLELVEDQAVRRLFLPGFTRPANAALFAAVWPDLADTLARLGEVDIDVIVDAGRMEGRGLPVPLLEAGAQVLLVTRSTLRSVAAAQTASTVLLDQAQSVGAPQPGVVLIGPARPYGRHEIGTALGLTVWDELADDRRSAGVLSDGEPRPRNFEHSPLVRSLHQLADRLAVALNRSSVEVGAAPSSESDLAPDPSLVSTGRS